MKMVPALCNGVLPARHRGCMTLQVRADAVAARHIRGLLAQCAARAASAIKADRPLLKQRTSIQYKALSCIRKGDAALFSCVAG